MANSKQFPGIVRFGVFEVDLRAGELRRDGLKVRLQEQPFRVLALLLEKPGEVITREEVREKLWSADTYVDFDKSLNATVNKLREALGDSAENPRFVQTLHRRGYRFIAPVQAIAAESSALEPAPAPPSMDRHSCRSFAAKRRCSSPCCVPAQPDSRFRPSAGRITSPTSGDSRSRLRASSPRLACGSALFCRAAGRLVRPFR